MIIIPNMDSASFLMKVIFVINVNPGMLNLVVRFY